MEASTQRKGSNQFIPNDLLNDLSSRFIINVPEEERVDLIRLCFQIELAHWFYLDFYCEENPKLPKMALKDFMRVIFGHIPFLQRYTAPEVDTVIADWREYKKAVPTFGAILLDHELKNVLLVQSFVYKASWGFPKGKVNKDEQPHHCAIREVLEETGFDITNLLDKEAYLEHYFNDQLIRLYIITDVPNDANFQPKTRNEIKGCEWFPINQLPVGRKDQTPKTNLSLNPNSFFMVIPFVKQLKKWVSNRMTEIDKHILKQQQLFAQLTKNEYARYTEGISPGEQKGRSTAFSPPPRMLKGKKDKTKASNPQAEDRIVVHSKFQKKINTEAPHTDLTQETPGASKRRSRWEETTSSQTDNNTSMTFITPIGTKAMATPTPETSKSAAVPKKPSMTNENGTFVISQAWQNFFLDREALIATFNINMRKTSSPKKYQQV